MSRVKAEFSIGLPQFLSRARARPPRARACSDQVENLCGDLFFHAEHNWFSSIWSNSASF